MSPSNLNEYAVEEATLEWFAELGYQIAHGPDLAPGEAASERDAYSEVVLVGRLREAIARLNPGIPTEAQEDALRKVLVPDSPSLVGINRKCHNMLRDGVEVEYSRDDGSIAGDHVRLLDFNDPDANDWLVLNQFTVIEGQQNRRADVVVFVNGLPLALLELKSAAVEEANIWTAWQQLQTYRDQIPSLFHHNELLIVSDGTNARLGSLTAGTEWFKPWRSIAGEKPPAGSQLELHVLIQGVFEKARFLKMVRHYITFEHDTDSDRIFKIVAGYHQFHAVESAMLATVTASQPEGDRRGGVVWHTQGSGKSFSMLFYAGRVILHGAMENPTIVVLTDRNDLDDQLFGQFQRCHELLRQMPIQADNREHLQELLAVASGGVIFTTIQKFLPEKKGDRFPQLSDRKNIVVIADEAHRSQYDLVDGFARNLRDALPSASYIGFTGTPIELDDKNTRAVFGDYVSIYDIEQAVADKATVPIYYESRVAKLALQPDKIAVLDQQFEEITEGEEVERKEKLKTRWAALEALVGDEGRLQLIAADLVDHFDKRREAMDGKAMIVCMSRRICVDLYNEIIKLRPDWHHEDDDQGEIKIIMTGSASDELSWQQHIRTKRRRKDLAKRFKNSKDSFRLVIVRDMWLTGFDAPCLTTMYVDKPMQGHGLMQAIARVNRVFRDKPGGLVVDYLGLAEQLKRALATYTQSGGQGSPTVDTADAVAELQKWHEVCCDMFHGFDWSIWKTGTAATRIALIPPAMDFILGQEDGKSRYSQAVTYLSKAFALCATAIEAQAIRDDIAFFQGVRTNIAKAGASQRSDHELDLGVRQLVSEAIAADGQVIDVFTAAGMERPDISILSEDFLEEVRNMPHRNLAVELLQKLLKAEIKQKRRKNVVQARSFAEMLQTALNAYHNRAIATHEIIDEMIRLAKEMQAANQRGESLGLSDDEVAFYDALAMNASAIDVMGIDELKVIATELVLMVRKNVGIDWTVRESARSRIRVMVRRILKKYGYPPDLREEATRTVLEQAETLCAEWA